MYPNPSTEVENPFASAASPAMAEVLEREKAWDMHVERTLAELQRTYTHRILPLERAYEYDLFRPSWFSDTVSQKRPFVTFLGPFSSGKSTFINYLLQSDHLLTGPQPLTDKFTVITYGERLQQITGRALLADSTLPFRELNRFGDTFAENVAGLVVPHPTLRSVTLVDTPGVLEAAGDVRARRYDYVGVVRWLAEQSDRVFFLFDPTKLDAGAELRAVFEKALNGLEPKIRIVLNKADTVQSQELLRVYGALFWNLSNLVRSTEPPRVYVSSFWSHDYQPGTNHELFSKEKEDLLYELIETVPLQSLGRRITSVMRRARDVLAWAVLCATYRSRIPAVFGKDKAKANFYEQYPSIVADLAARYRLSEHDFPAQAETKAHLTRVPSHEYANMEKLKKRHWIPSLQAALDRELPALLAPIEQQAVVDPRDRKRTIAALRAYRVQAATEEAMRTPADGRVVALPLAAWTAAAEPADSCGTGAECPQTLPHQSMPLHERPAARPTAGGTGGGGGEGGESSWREAGAVGRTGGPAWYESDIATKPV